MGAAGAAPRIGAALTTIAVAGLLALPAPAEARGRTASAAAEGDMVTAINKVRARHGLHAFRSSRSLNGSASRFSRWLMANDTFRHLNRIQASQRFAMLGEALAWHAGRSFGVQRTISQWMGSPPHRALMLSPTMQWGGAGVTRGRLGATEATIWVLHVGRIHPLGTSVPDLPLP
jgi:uncharacterized protein YkwD